MCLNDIIFERFKKGFDDVQKRKTADKRFFFKEFNNCQRLKVEI